MSNIYVLILGTPSTGIEIVGPFDDIETASISGDRSKRIDGTPWEVVELIPPE